MQKFIVYTDGSSKGNPGPGGWAAILIGALRQAQGNNEEFVVEIGGREEKTTNNRMEMKAAIGALKYVEEACPNNEIGRVEIHADSEYLINGITKWIYGWQANGWRTKDKKQVLNQDLWEELAREASKREVNWQKVAGHSGHALNDRCDEIATGFADGKKMDLYNGPKEKYK